MNPYLKELAKQLAEKINEQINLPWLNEEQERLFFELVVTKLFEIIFGDLLHLVQTQKKEA